MPSIINKRETYSKQSTKADKPIFEGDFIISKLNIKEGAQLLKG